MLPTSGDLGFGLAPPAGIPKFFFFFHAGGGLRAMRSWFDGGSGFIFGKPPPPPSPPGGGPPPGATFTRVGQAGPYCRHRFINPQITPAGFRPDSAPGQVDGGFACDPARRSTPAPGPRVSGKNTGTRTTEIRRRGSRFFRMKGF